MGTITIERVERPKPSTRKIGVFDKEMIPLDGFRKFKEDNSKRAITVPEWTKYFFDEKGRLKHDALTQMGGSNRGWILNQSILYTQQKPGPVPIYEFIDPIKGEEIDEIPNAVVFEEDNNKIITDLGDIKSIKKGILSYIKPTVKIRVNEDTGTVEWIITKGNLDPIIQAKPTKDGLYKINPETGLPDQNAETNLELYVYLRDNGEYAGFPHGSGYGDVRVLSLDVRLAGSSRVFHTNAEGE